jgi:hypothetical protein
MHYIKLFTLTVFIIMQLAVNAQSPTNFTVSGSARDNRGEKVVGATILLLSSTDTTKMTSYTTTASNGSFQIKDVKYGTYFIKAISIGYTTKKTELFTVNSDIVLTELILLVNNTALSEVVVKGEGPLTTQKLGVISVNLNSSFLKSATTALDALSQIPYLRVDSQGNISLSNGISPVVYIDGKQIPVTVDELRSISKADIESIDITPNASARYDGETKAVIEIKIKRDKSLGIKGNSFVNTYKNRKYFGGDVGISSTYKTKKAAYYARAGISLYNNFLDASTLRFADINSGVRTRFLAEGFSHTNSLPFSYQFSADYNLTPKNTMGIYVKGSTRSGIESAFSNNFIDANTGSFILPSTSDASGRSTSLAVDLNEKISFNDKSSLVSYVDIARYGYRQQQLLTTMFGNDNYNRFPFPALLRSDAPSYTNIYSARSDYSRIVSKEYKLTAGFKTVYTYTNNDIQYDSASLNNPDQYYYDNSRSNRFTYKELVSGAYVGAVVDYDRNLLDLSVRAENTLSEGQSVTLHSTVDRNYWKILPSFRYQHNWSKIKNTSIGYSRKLSRPTFFDLNPFRFYNSPYSYSEGNPFLLPSITNTADVNFTYKDFTLTLKYTIFENQFGQLPLQDATTQVLTFVKSNIDRIRNVSIEGNHSYQVAKWWKIQHYLVLFQTYTKSNFDFNTINNKAFSLYVYGQHSFSLPKGISLNMSYNYSSPSASQIYRTKSNGTVNVAAQRSFFKEKISAQLNVSDILNSYREAFYGKYNNVDLSTLQKRGVQQISVRITYLFGNSLFNRSNRSSGSAEEENRANR